MIVVVLLISIDGLKIMTKIKTTAKLLHVFVFIHCSSIYIHLRNIHICVRHTVHPAWGYRWVLHGFQMP